MGQRLHGTAWLVASAWDVGVFTLRGGGGTWENALRTHPLARGSVGLASGRWARGPHLFRPGGRPDVIPTKNPGCLHHSRWRSSVFVEHFAQVWYTFLVFRAFRSYKYTLVSRQSICILSFNLLYHRFLTSSAVWWPLGLSPFAIRLSHLSTHIRWADSVTSILYNRFFAESGFPSSFRKFARPPPKAAPSDVCMSSSCLFFHNSFALFHTVSLSVASHSEMMCSSVSYLLQIGHSALSSYPGMWFQDLPSL